MASAPTRKGKTTSKTKPKPKPKRDGAKNDSKPRSTTASALVSLVLKVGVQLFNDGQGTAYASVPMNDYRANLPLSSSQFKSWLRRAYYVAKEPRAAASSNAIADAVGALTGLALYDAPTAEVHLRVSGQNDKIYLSLADDRWRVAGVDPSGWRIENNAPVRFRRPKGMQALPEPKRGGSLDLLRPFLNVEDDDGWRLAVSWLLAALRPCGPYPLMMLSGQQGSSKSTTARVLRSLIDPNAAPIRCEPKEARDLMIAANAGWVLALDNLSHVPAWLSDALCRLSTGGGFSTRQLYTDGEEIIFDAQRPVILTSIEDVVNRGDLLDRAIVLTLPPIPEAKRQPESDFWSRFEAARPQILGALLDAVAVAMKILPTVKLTRLPRMADFALWATACERAIKWPTGSFLCAYERNRAAANEVALESSPLVAPIQQLLTGSPYWSGTASEFLVALSGFAGEKATRGQDWPKSAKSLSGKLRRLAPNLAGVGIRVEYEREGRDRKRLITVMREEKSPDFASASSAASAPAENTENTSDFVRTQTRTQEPPADANPPFADASVDRCVRTKTAKNAGKTAYADATDATDAKSGDFSPDIPNGPDLHQTPWG